MIFSFFSGNQYLVKVIFSKSTDLEESYTYGMLHLVVADAHGVNENFTLTR